ncbi:BA14K family protein [Ancylobacter dichloromethanicus]|nr:BA14K family protein [Ancylobacter dichloromethanicus]
MKKLSIALATAAMVVTSSVMPAMSAPIMPQTIAKPDSNIEQVQYRPGYRQGKRQGYRQGYRQGHRQGARRGYWASGGRHYYNGHRGYNYYRPGYRQYNGWWFPAGAFAAGALIGGALGAAASQPSYAGGNAHIQWCANHYRSYRASDNTFQPYNGPRQQCVSPY